MQDLGYLWTLYLSLPIVQNLSVFMADALLHCQFLGGVTARTLVVERALQQ